MMLKDISSGVDNDQALVKSFVEMFIDFPVASLIADLQTRVGVLDIEKHSFPYTVNDISPTPNSYLVSPKRAYIDYALDETRNFSDHPKVQKTIQALIRACAPLVGASGLDRQIQLNNWLFSTNPMPELTPNEARILRDTLTTSHPDHAIVIRSLNELADAKTINALGAAGFTMVASRQIYIVSGQATLTKNMKEDRRKIHNSKYSYVGNEGFSKADYARCETLYAMLYLEKYSILNPHYTARYIEHMHARKIMRLVGFKDANGILVAVTGLFENGKTLTQPIVGYDTTLPMTEGLYRMIMAVGQDHAFEQNLFFNMSAGAADFKRRRNAQPVIEFSAVYTKHLSLRCRLATQIVAGLLRRIGIPLLQRYEL